MQIWEFLRELAIFFPLSGSEERQNKIFDSYAENLVDITTCDKKYDYDWKKVLQIIQRTYTYQRFPSLADIINCLPEARIYKPYQESEYDGRLVVITLPNGYKYSFTTHGTGKPIHQIQESLKDKYGTIKTEIFPKGSVLIGNTVIKP